MYLPFSRSLLYTQRSLNPYQERATSIYVFLGLKISLKLGSKFTKQKEKSYSGQPGEELFKGEGRFSR